MKLKLEVTFDDLNKTSVEKEFDEWCGSQLGTLVTEIAFGLMAMGYGEKQIREYISYVE